MTVTVVNILVISRCCTIMSLYATIYYSCYCP